MKGWKVPKAPPFTVWNIVKAGMISIIIILASLVLNNIYDPLAIIPSALVLIAAIYLIGGELLEKFNADQ